MLIDAAAPPSLRASWPWWALAAIAIVAGIWLRLDQLHAQMLIDDEWHAVRMLIGSDAIGILTHFGRADHSIPLTLFYRALYDLGGLDEWRMHLPPVVAGIALLGLAPWSMRRSVALPVRAIWVALMAISPILVYLSRTARPYALDVLFAFVAIVAFHAWLRDPRSRATAAVYVVSTVLAAWLHLLTIVFTLWPFLFFGVRLLAEVARKRDRDAALAPLLRLVALGAATVIALAIVLLPPLVVDFGAMAGKAGADSVSIGTLWRAVAMMFGLSAPIASIVPLLLLVLGIAERARRDPVGTASIVSMIVVGMAVIAIARPAWIQHSLTFVRYSLPVLPFVLLFVAEGLFVVVARLRAAVLAALAAAACCTTIVAAGPLPSIYRFPNDAMGHAVFQFDYDAATNPYLTELELGPVPAFYHELSRRPPGSLTLIEAPGRLISNYVDDPWMQAIHRQHIKHAIVAPVCGGDADEFPYRATGTRFRNVVRLSDLLAGATAGADYLVLRRHPWSIPPGYHEPWPDMASCIATVRARLGTPVYEDTSIVVFGLGANAATK